MLDLARTRPGVRLTVFISVFLGLAISSLLSCRPSTPERWRTLAKFADAEAISWISPPSLFKREVVFQWRFDTAEDVAPWGKENIDMAFERKDRGLFIRSSSTDPYIYRDGVLINTSEIDQIRVKRSPNHGEPFQIFWAPDGEHFTEERSLRQDRMDSVGKQLPYYTFDVGKHPEWRGTIGRFRLDPAEISKRRSKIMAIEGTRNSLDGEKLATLVDRPFLQDFNSDARLALLAPPGYVHKRALENLPAGARLRFGYGVQQSEGREVTFRVEAVPEGGEPKVLFSKSLNPKSDHTQWTLAEVSLADLAGQNVELRLITDGPSPDELLDGFPLWAHPTVSAPTDEELPPNVVLIIADTLRADRMSLYGYEHQTTPRIDAWANEHAVVFEQTVAAAPWTLPAHVSMLTGLNPLRHATNYTEATPDSLELLAERLRDEGYSTAAVTGGGFLAPPFGLTQGFEWFKHWGNITDPDHEAKAGLDLDEHLPKALDYLSGAPSGPFFLMFHTYEVHAPYNAEQPWFDRFSPSPGEDPSFVPLPGTPLEENAWRFDSVLRENTTNGMVPVSEERMPVLQAVYDSGVAKMDDAVGRLIDRIADLDLDRETIIVFTSDHGEGLGDRGKVGHAYLYDFNLMIPMVISIPGREGGRRIGGQVRQVDLTPTILEALGLDPQPAADGVSLLRFWETDEDPSFPQVAESYAGSSNYGLSLRVANRWKYILQHSPWKPIYGQQELFDLREDPQEGANRSEADLDRVKSFRQEIEQRYEDQSCRFQVTARNRGVHDLEVFFHGDLAQSLTVKTMDLQCDECARWYKSWSRLVLKPGEQSEIFLEGALHSDLKARVRFRDGSPHSEDRPGGMTRLVPAWDIIQGQYFGVRAKPGQRWGEVRKERPWKDDESGFAVVWLGDGCPWIASGQTPQAPQIDDETRKQLEALGYVGN